MSGQSVTLTGTKLWVDDTGELDLPPVVCLHSLFLDNTMFDDFTAAAAGRFRVIRPEFRGQGRSAPATEDSVDMDTCARDIEELLDEMDLGPVHMLVQSMGGDVGFRFAARRLDVVRSMVVLGSSARAEPPEQLERFRRWVDDVGERGFVDDILETTMEIMFGQSTRSDPAKQEMLEHWRSRIAAVPPTLRPAMAGVIERSSCLDVLPKITVPVLVVSGEEDLPRPPAWADEVVEALPNVELLRLSKVGHSPTLEAPEIVIPRILAFFSDVDAPSRGA